MGRIFVPSRGPEDWRRLLAEPEKQWRDGYSAKMLAECWETAEGFPEAMRRAFERSGTEALAEIEPLVVLPEYQTRLPGGSRPSQTDVFVLAKARGGLVAIAVEGKVEEPFGPTVAEWLVGASEGKRERLDFICKTLKLDAADLGPIRYQLLHRATAAILEAQRFNAARTVMLVHSFSWTRTWFEDFAAFARLLGTRVDRDEDRVVDVGLRGSIRLYLGWVMGEKHCAWHSGGRQMLKDPWRKHFFESLESLEEPPFSDDAKWTDFMGEVLDRVSERMSCYVARRRPQAPETGEHLQIDAVFFEEQAWNRLGPNEYGGDPLVFPRAVVELENSFNFDKIAYCLWKLLCIRSPLRVLICYQPNRQGIEALRQHLRDCIRKGDLLTDEGELLVLVGDDSADQETSWEHYYVELESGDIRGASR